MRLREISATPKTMEKLNRWKRDVQNLATQSYRPFLTVRVVNKVGRRHWMFCVVQKRHVHLLSDGEKRMYKKLLWGQGVIRVLEQYALNLDETLDIAVAANLIHPRNWETSEAHVMTTDFVVQKRDPDQPSRIVTIAYSFKYASQIFHEIDEDSILEQTNSEGFSDSKPLRKNARTWQKFAIEHEYWRCRGVEYRIVTELDATKEEIWNIEFCESAGKLSFPDKLIQSFVLSFCQAWQKHFKESLDFLLALVGQELACSESQSLKLFQYCVLKHFLPLKHSSCLQFYRPVELSL